MKKLKNNNRNAVVRKYDSIFLTYSVREEGLYSF